MYGGTAAAAATNRGGDRGADVDSVDRAGGDFRHARSTGRMGDTPGARRRPARPNAAPAVLWFCCVALAVFSAGALAALAGRAVRDDRRDPHRWVWAASWCAVGAVAVVLCARAYPGTFYVEKALTRLAMPTAAVWVALLALAGWRAYHRRWPSFILAAAAAAVLTAAGNPVVAALAARSLEAGYDADPFAAGNFDAVCVLGGGVSLDRHDAPAVNAYGQRAILAARLYHAGRTPALLAAGTAPPSSTCPGPGEVTRDLWTGLAVPRAAVRLVDGTTTSEELRSLAAAAAAAEAEGRPWGRIGLVSSAWHLPRAVRLAGAAGLLGKPGCEVVPLPADSLATLSTTAPRWIPEADSLAVTERCLREWLARLVAR